jgi:hypothetical protein
VQLKPRQPDAAGGKAVALVTSMVIKTFKNFLKLKNVF